ncbi:Rv3235 family protein [Micrococcus sp. KRD128]|uniref:Rv3235 family protein n=1 Tax=Micrococcus sp. KRD128 TaxID=2729722 RepID=UPI00406CB521
MIAVACVEVETGRRALRDLSAWLSPEVLDKLTRRMELLGAVAPTGPGRRPAAAVPPRASASAPRPVGARVCEVAPGRVEASATVLWEGRARAFALRLERRLSRWKVTSVEIG